MADGDFSATKSLDNCSYRYSSDDVFTSIAMWIDGPCTMVAAMLSFLGAYFAVRFLWKAGLNKDLTAALFALCAVDSLLMVSVVFLHSLEATSVLVFDANPLFDKQSFVLSMHGIASSLTTTSTLLVIYITFIRFLVVFKPLQFGTISTASLRLQKGASTQRSVDRPLHRQSTKCSLMSFRRTPLKKIIKPFCLPATVMLFSFFLNIPVYFEMSVMRCFDVEHDVEASNPVATNFRKQFAGYKAVLMTFTQTVVPVVVILVLSLITEYRVHASLIARRKLFECQNRRRSVVITEELKERVSRTVAIFIAVKFLILRSMPVFFDVYENLYGIESFGMVMSVLVRVSDFLIVLNSATNSLAYFGRKTWLQRRLRQRLLKKEEKRNAKIGSKSSLEGSSIKEKSKDLEKGCAVAQFSTGKITTVIKCVQKDLL